MENPDLKSAAESHFAAVADKNIERILDFYTSSENLLIFVEGPRWATLGFENVSKGWRDFCDSAIIVKSCEWVEFLQRKTVGRMGFVAGIVRMNLEIGGEPKSLDLRGTFVLEREADEKWRVVHEHFSQPAADPYGIGDWLKK